VIVSELYLATKLALEVSLKRVHLIVDFHYVFVYCVLLLLCGGEESQEPKSGSSRGGNQALAAHRHGSIL
jgi:hypothetical protein